MQVSSASSDNERYLGVIVNTARIRSRGSLTVRLEPVRAAGWKLIVAPTTPASPGERQARELMAAGVRGIVVAGGDGTLGAAVNGMLKPSGRLPFLTPLPTGTANLFAANLPADTATRVSVGSVSATRGNTPVHRLFLTAAGFGNSAEVLAGRRDIQPGWLQAVRHLPLPGRLAGADPGWLSYAGAGFRALKRPPITAEIDGEPVMAWSIEYGSLSGVPRRLRVFPGASLGAGTLEELLFQPRGCIDWVRAARVGLRAGKNKGASRTEQVLAYRTVTAEMTPQLRFPTPTLMHTDGEVLGRVDSARMRVLPQALTAVPVSALCRLTAAELLRHLGVD